MSYCITLWSQPKDNNTRVLNSSTGEAIIALLQLNITGYGRVDTTIGDKTPIGLALTIERIITDVKFAKSIVRGDV